MRIFALILLVEISLIGISCKKSTAQTTVPVATVQKGISYPDSIYYGKNILTLPDSTILSVTKNYDMGAVLEKDANLSLIITNLSANDTATGHIPVWLYDNNTGWAAQNYTSNNTQKFISAQTGKIDLEINFDAYGKQGKCKIDFYENSTSITRTKYLKWQ